MALATIGDRVIVGIANNGLWTARWDTTTAPPGLVEWQRLTTPGLPAAQPFETPTALPDDVSPAAAAIVAITKGAQTTLAVETGGEGLWEATWVPGAAPLTWTQVAPPAGLPGGVAREVAYVPARRRAVPLRPGHAQPHRPARPLRRARPARWRRCRCPSSARPAGRR